jgi:hypothetical protein
MSLKNKLNNLEGREGAAKGQKPIREVGRDDACVTSGDGKVVHLGDTQCRSHPQRTLAHTHTHIYAQTHTHTYIYMHKHKYSHTHTYTHT